MGILVDWQIRKLCEDYVGSLSVLNNTTYFGDRLRDYTGEDRDAWRPMIDPFSEAAYGDGIISYGLTTAGYDLRLSKEFKEYNKLYGEVMDPKGGKDPSYDKRVYRDVVADRNYYILAARASVLAQSIEYLHIPRNLKGRCVGKSTWARCAVIANLTPLEPNWHGRLTLEISNLTDNPVRLHVGEGIVQLEFERLDAVPEKDYADRGGKYQGQTEVTPARVL